MKVIGGELRLQEIQTEVTIELANKVVGQVRQVFDEQKVDVVRVHGNINADGHYTNDEPTRALVVRIMTSVFTKEFTDCTFTIECDEKNNSFLTVAVGSLYIDIMFKKI